MVMMTAKMVKLLMKMKRYVTIRPVKATSLSVKSLENVLLRILYVTENVIVEMDKMKRTVRTI